MFRHFAIPVAALIGALVVGSSGRADIFTFVLQGQAGYGLLAGNETGAINGTPGSGGILGGITYNDQTNQLSINVGWGSGNGFLDLTGTANAMHVHGPTASAAPTAFTQNAGVLINLGGAGFSNSATNGGYNNTVILAEANEVHLFAGQLYINVHTTLNPGGEIRGNLIAIPEPSALGLSPLLLYGLARVRRRK